MATATAHSPATAVFQCSFCAGIFELSAGRLDVSAACPHDNCRGHLRGRVFLSRKYGKITKTLDCEGERFTVHVYREYALRDWASHVSCSANLGPEWTEVYDAVDPHTNLDADYEHVHQVKHFGNFDDAYKYLNKKQL